MTPGSKLGPYEILALIGAGGMGEVYRARDTRLGRDVALKVLLSAFASDPDRIGAMGQKLREHLIGRNDRAGAKLDRQLHHLPVGLVSRVGECDPVERIGEDGHTFLLGAP